ncbi:hypothetical protein B0675_39460 [Streptomyces sp. M41(2017)]|nr:hypothetical protein B0675_39460 [Streptomyces sp. M41(2017)]
MDSGELLGALSRGDSLCILEVVEKVGRIHARVFFAVPGQRPAVSLGKVARAEHDLNLFRKVEQAQLVGHPGAVLAQSFSGSGACASLGLFAADRDECFDTASSLDDIEVFAFQVLLEEVVYERFTAGGQVVADDEVQGIQADMDGAAEAALAVDEDVFGLADPLIVVRPQGEIGRAGDRDTRGKLRLAQLLAETSLVLVAAEVAARIEGSGGDLIQPQPNQLVRGHIPLRHSLRPTTGTAGTPRFTE